MDETARSQFNLLLIKHLERLTGSPKAIGKLPYSIDNIGILIILGGREIEILDFYSEVTDRYSMEEFLKEAKDTGIEDDEHFQAALQEMIEKKYVDLRPDGHVYGCQDSKNTAQLLNKIFPRMQGINLLAYIWQTIGEFTSGRTSLEDALSRFDQTMNIHGVAPAKPKIPTLTLDDVKTKPVAEAEEEKKPAWSYSKGSPIIRNYVVKGAHPETKAIPREPAAPASRVETKPVVEDKYDETAVLRQSIAELEKRLFLQEQDKKEEIPAAPKENNEDAVIPVDNMVDDMVAEKIAAFEKALALKCPLCKTGILQEKSTAAGKIFYACKSEGCNFISWGKPHYLECKICKNPFLVEVTDSNDQMILRCPRATCHYHQALNAVPVGTPPKGVKVVRKRLVRRKI